MTLNVDTNEWYSNKIKGGVAESACRAHFEALGYNVEAFGIEQIAPQYCKVAKAHVPKGTAINNFAEKLQNMPDFLVSRIHPSSAKGLAGHADAFLVDAKFRHSVNLEAFDVEILTNYKNIIERGIDFYVYLLANRLQYNHNGKPSESRVAIGHFSNSRTTGLWNYATDKATQDLEIFRGVVDGSDFASVYTDAILPSITYLLGSVENT